MTEVKHHMIDNNFALNSNSGDQLRLEIIANQRCIIKTSKTQRSRLKKCAEIQRQEANKKSLIPGIQTVPITEITDHQFYCEVKMPYIAGLSGQNIYLYLPPKKILSISAKLTAYAFQNLQQCNDQCNVDQFRTAVAQKIKEIEIGVRKNDEYQIKQSTMNMVRTKILQLMDGLTTDCPVGKCHGDLTFSNIVYEKETNAIWLIDYLDSFIESPYIDLAKLVQEYRHGWSARHLQPSIQKNATLIGLHTIRTLEQYPKLIETDYMRIFSIINLYRISPYLKDCSTLQWLEKSILREIKCIY